MTTETCTHNNTRRWTEDGDIIRRCTDCSHKVPLTEWDLNQAVINGKNLTGA